MGLVNQGDGTFSRDSVGISGVTLPKVYDMDGDGDMDLVTSNYSEGRLTIYENVGDMVFDSIFSMIVEARIELSIGIASLDVADYDGNGFADYCYGIRDWSLFW